MTSQTQAPDQPDEERSPFRQRSTLIMALIFGAIIVAGRFSPWSPVRNTFNVFGWVTEQALHITKDLFESYGYLTVFLAPLAENTIFLGALIPGTLVMLLAGVSARDGFINIWIAIPLAIAGAMIGDTISYGIGRFGRGRMGPESRMARWAEEMREPLMNHSVWLVLSYHFAGYSRLVGPAAAGFLRMPMLRWMLLDYAGVALWVATFMAAGYALGVAGLSLDDSERNVQIFEIILFVFFAIAVVTMIRAVRSRVRQGDGGDADPDDVAALEKPSDLR